MLPRSGWKIKNMPIHYKTDRAFSAIGAPEVKDEPLGSTGSKG
jgi:hypothetical protein